MLLHLRVVPGFGLAVEMMRRPEIRAQPAVLGGLPHQRGIVREVNSLAQERGVRIGMALSQAHQQCPYAVFLVPDLPRYQAVWGEICAILGRFTPLVQPLTLGQAICDLSGCERSAPARSGRDLSGMVRAIAADIRRYGILSWLGVASNWITAELASIVVGEEGITIVEPGWERAFLADLPLSLLPGLDPRMALTFQVLGLRTIGQLAELPPSAVRQRFGVAGERLHAWACGVDSRPVLPPNCKPAVMARRACDEGTIEEAVELIHCLAEECAAELQRRHLAGKMITLKLWWARQAATPLILSQSSQPLAVLPLAPTGPGASTEEISETAMKCSLPVPYRIHSMLPQPGNRHISSSFKVVVGPIDRGKIADPAGSGAGTPPAFDAVAATVRTPVSTAPPMIERAERLLLRQWPRSAERAAGSTHALQAIELEVSEFEQPAQLSFAEIDRIGETGGLRGMDTGRRQMLLQQEELLAARYGDPTFRHVTDVDPSSILTERRFRWSVGLSREPVARTRRKR